MVGLDHMIANTEMAPNGTYVGAEIDEMWKALNEMRKNAKPPRWIAMGSDMIHKHMGISLPPGAYVIWDDGRIDRLDNPESRR